MAIVTKDINPDWHESNLIIQVLSNGALLKRELLQRVRERQKEKPILGEKGITHSQRAYKYWLTSLIHDQIVIESEGQIRLTALGEWLANSKMGTLEDRYLFIENLSCLDCKKAGYIVLLKIDPSTATVNSKGTLRMNIECPRCGYKQNPKGISAGLSANQFIKFYNQAIAELQRATKTMPQITLPC